MPRVSVVIPVYNAAATLSRAIDSVFEQTFTDYEVIAVDDGSRDESRQALARYADRITILEQPNRGPSGARNAGVKASSGEYLGFLDADDWWKPEMIARTAAALDADPKCALVYTDLMLVDSRGCELKASMVGARQTPSVTDMLERLWPILPSGVVMRRRSFDQAGGFPEALTSFEDVFFWLLVREHGHFVYIPEPLAIWRFAHFPDPLKAGGGQDEAGRIFDRMMVARYGVRGMPHVRARRRAPRSILGYIGLRAAAAGDQALARRAFARAVALDPWRVKTYLRLARTFLPAGVSRALTGRTRELKL